MCPCWPNPATGAARVQRVLVVDCSEDTQVARVAQRPSWTPRHGAAGGAASKPPERHLRRRMADAVLHNDGIGLADLQAQVQALWRCWLHPQGRPQPVPN